MIISITNKIMALWSGFCNINAHLYITTKPARGHHELADSPPHSTDENTNLIV